MEKFWPFRLNAKGDKRPLIYTNHIHFYSKLSVISVADDSPDFIHNLLENIPWNVPRTIAKPEILNVFWARSSWNYDMPCNQPYQWEMFPLISLVIIPEKNSGAFFLKAWYISLTLPGYWIHEKRPWIWEWHVGSFPNYNPHFLWESLNWIFM